MKNCNIPSILGIVSVILVIISLVLMLLVKTRSVVPKVGTPMSNVAKLFFALAVLLNSISLIFSETNEGYKEMYCSSCGDDSELEDELEK